MLSVLVDMEPQPTTSTKDATQLSSASASHTQTERFEPLVIIEFGPGTKPAAQEWLTAKLQASRADKGSELRVVTSNTLDSKETMLYLGATTDRLLIGAEEMKLQKKYLDGTLRDINLTDLDNFVDADDLDSFLTKAEKQRIILKGIESLRATEDEPSIPGYSQHTLYPGKSIIKKYLSRKIVVNMFPLHGPEKLKRLGSDWYTLPNYFKIQPIDRIQEYFGAKVGLYFSFLGIYTISLIPPALMGVIYFFYPTQSMYREASFAIFNLVWSTIFLEGWKRYCNALSYKWGTLQDSSGFFHSFEEPRADYYGIMGKNPVTGQPEPVYPKWKRVAKFYLVTLPVLSVCLACAFFAMLGYFWMEDWMLLHGPKDAGIFTSINALVPTIIYSVQIIILNQVYRTIATKLNKYENHRLQSSYDNHLITKLILFEFINCFICLFYVAFYLQNRKMLKIFLGTNLITTQIVGQLSEALVPFLFLKSRQSQVEKNLNKAGTPEETEALIREDGGKDGGADEVDPAHHRQALMESKMERHPGSNDEYLEMYIQFGYVYLFSSAFPLAALWALINNIFEIRTDAFKMCRVFQRPFAESANNIGAWMPAFEVIGLISVITNCALIGMDPNIQTLLPSNLSAVNMVLIFVVCEHIVLAIKAGVALMVPDVPYWVVLQIARQEYAAKQALRKQALRRSNFSLATSVAQSRKSLPLIKIDNASLF